MVEGHTGCEVALHALSVADFILAKRATDFLCQSLVLSEFVEKWFVEEVLNILGVVECGRWCRVFGGFALVARLSWIDTWL